ncbi:MAG TPA: class I SAM-dependent methyltransferase [Phycisphaerales bacterium]|nr:class I SAM-dependent methyltransferase [Phycisphaerales bacterium]
MEPHSVTPATTPATASAYFGQMVDAYDSLIRRAVPRYEEMIERLLEILPPVAVNVLELGCGTGSLTLKLLSRYRSANVTTVDAAPEMTRVTSERAGYDPRLVAVTARFEQLEFPAQSFDLIASSMSLHHVVDKAALYRSFAAWLKPGGELCFADQLAGATERANEAHWDLWYRFCREPGHCTEEEIASLVDHSHKHDHYVPLREHTRMLEDAGFTGVDLHWRTGMYSVMSARRGV